MNDFLLLVCGLVILLLGGETLVRGAVGLARNFNISPNLVGLTLVAAGTSAPELVVSLQAALSDNTEIALGNVVGSNIFNLGAILGLVALVRPQLLSKDTFKREWPALVAATLALLLLCQVEIIGRLPGGLLVCSLVGFTLFLIKMTKREHPSPETESKASPLWLSLALLPFGVICLALGARWFVQGGSSLAGQLGASETVIGLTVVALGTCLPELLTSLIAAIKGNSSIAVSNILGSNIFNILGILGLTALISPLPVASEIASRDIWVLVLVTLVSYPLMKSSMTLNRWEGALLLLLSLAYTSYLVFSVTV